MVWRVFGGLLLVLAAAPAQTPGPEAAQLQSAFAHLNQGKYEDAVRECKRVLAGNPRSAPAHLLLGEAYLIEGSISMAAEAKAQLQEALDIDPHLLWAHFYLARIYLDLGRYERAKEQLDLGLKDRPNVPHLLSLLGEVNRNLGNPQVAIELNQKALAADPKMTPAHYYEGLAYQDLHQDDAAIREFEAAVHSPYVSPEMFVALAGEYAKKGKFSEGEALCKKGIALDPSRPDAHIALARLYNDQNNGNKALDALKKAFDPGKPIPTTARSQQLQADAVFEEGRAYEGKEMTKDAVASFLHCVEIDPDRGAAHQQLAKLYHRLGDSVHAREQAAAAAKFGAPVDPILLDRIQKAK